MDGEAPPQEVPREVIAALRRMGFTGALSGAERLTGGVSSDIWRVDFPTGPVCVKRALERLRVSADWCAPVERNRYEARWMRQAGAAAPGCVPALLGQDEEAGALAMAYLPPQRFPLWKTELHAGRADPDFAAATGAALARIHAASAAAPGIAAAFPTDAIFFAIRLEPYLLATAAKHPDRADALHAIMQETRTTRRALVHGDVSPKNILAGEAGPVFLDAECAWWGDPAFDVAFCLTHLLLKCLWTPPARDRFLACFDAFTAAHAAGIGWEAPDDLRGRVARLLPALLLARVDGKSPVEYLTGPDRTRVRRFARAWLAAPAEAPGDVCAAWRKDLTA